MTAHTIATLFGAGWMIALTAASVVYRRRRGKPLVRPEFDRPRFLETWRSVRRPGRWPLGSAQHCYWIAVEGDALRVGPHCPFTLAFFPELGGLEVCVPARQIRGMELRPHRTRPPTVAVTFERRPGRVETIELSLADPDAFERAVGAAWRASAAPATP